MRRNCNLELRLVPPSSMENKWSPEEKQPQQQQLTMFYNGKLVVTDVSDVQARALILLASRVVEEKTKSPSTISEPSTPSSTPTGLSMKKSLQRFLQKRQNRIQATSPYHH